MKNIINKYAIKNGKLVHIDSLSRTFERGLNSRCYCPHCGDTLSARFPEGKSAYFAHSKGACNKNDYLLSVFYYALRDAVEEKEIFYTPALYGNYRFLPAQTEVYRDSVEKNIKLSPVPKERYEELAPSSWNHCGGARFFKGPDNKIAALIVNWKNYNYDFAIVMNSPELNVKKLHIPSQNIVLLNVDSLQLTDKTTLENLKFLLRGDKVEKKWLRHYKVDKYIDKCMKQQISWNQKQKV